MDFSYFTSAPAPYQFFGLPPTPATAPTSQVEDYRAHSAPDQYDPAFATFQQSFQYEPNNLLAQPHQIPLPSPAKSPRNDSITSIPDLSTNNVQLGSADVTPDEQRARSSSEEKESMTPAQSRRKAQNRAAQRAFRERKERHVKDLEAKLTTLEHQSVSLNGENERLKRELAKIATENEILRATSGSSLGSHSHSEDPDELIHGPMTYSPTDFKSEPSSRETLLNEYKPVNSNYSATRRIFIDAETGEPLLAAGATWDYIQAHELFRKGLVDVGDVCERLRKMARCDGQGPVFEESDVRRAIVESAAAGGRDELI